MPSIELGLKEEAVLSAIVTWRLNGDNDILEYDPKEVQKILNQSEDSKRLVITLDIQRNIVMELSKRKILVTDQIVDNRFDNIFNLRIDPYSIEVPSSRPDFSWANQTDWAYRELQKNGEISIEDAYAKYGDKLFIRMTTEDIENINNCYMASHTIEPKLIKSPRDLKIRFYVVIDGGEPICISELRNDKKPQKILVEAFKKKGTTVYRSDLINRGILSKEDANKSLKTDILKDNKHILNAAPFLLKIYSNRLKIERPRKVTLYELNQMKKKLKIN